ncbi:MAG: DUF4012 domain-containing protein [Actinomycetota bacterium]|nr:DUF4012 domain-containing protein [Actinomycetota bacterium]
MVGIGGLLLLGAAWIAVTGVESVKAAHKVEQDLQAIDYYISTGQLTQVRAFSADLATQSARAHRLTTGPAWWMASEVPYLGRPFAVVRGLTNTAHEMARETVPDVVGLATELDPSKLRPSGNTINLNAVIAAAPQLARVVASVDHAARRLSALPGNTWLGSVNHARQRVSDRLTTVAGYVTAADRMAKVLPQMAGDNGLKRYFVGLQNEAELRGSGGVPGSFAIMVADHGVVTFTTFASDQTLLPPPTQHVPTGLNFGSKYDAAWGASQPTQDYLDSNASPNFSYAAQIWAKMWEKVTGNHIDGAISLDPTALSYFLAVTGPTQTANGTVVDASNVVALTQSTVYTLYPDNQQRKDFLVSLTKAVDKKLISGSGSAQSLLRAGARAGAEHRFQVWFGDPGVENVLQQSSFAGIFPQSSQPFSAVILNNAAAGKLDYYVTRSIAYQSTGCGPTRDILVTVALTNNAPLGLPAYVVGRIDTNAKYAHPGDDRLFVDYVATDGAQILSLTHNDVPTTVAPLSESGHPMFRFDLELPRGTTQTLAFHLLEPAGAQPPDIWLQPGVSPVQLTYFEQRCT